MDNGNNNRSFEHLFNCIFENGLSETEKSDI